MRVTGILEVHGFVAGFYEKDKKEIHTPFWQHILQLIAVEILSDHQIDQATDPD